MEICALCASFIYNNLNYFCQTIMSENRRKKDILGITEEITGNKVLKIGREHIGMV